MKNREIYLDSNIYLAIANREVDYEYTLAKLNNLRKSGFIFPHAPPHAEEISVRISNRKDVHATFRYLNLVRKFNGGFGYLPGFPNESETEKLILEFQSNVGENPALRSALEIHGLNLKKLKSGELTEAYFQTLLVREDFHACLARVDKHLDLTDLARKNDIFHLGRRNGGSLKSNFEKIGKSTFEISTFEEIQNKFNLGPRRLSNISSSEIFKDKDFLRFMEVQFAAEGIDFSKIPTGHDIMQSHHKKENIITLILNNMERAGYHQENKNHEATLTGRMHDVTHAIYASRADYFVTNDARFSKKVAATYIRLGIPTKVVSSGELLTIEPYGR